MDFSPGSNDSVAKTVHDYSASMLRLAYSYVKNRADAEDLVQEVFITYVLKTPCFENDALKKAWLLKVTRNKCLDFLKSAWKRHTTELTEELSYLPDRQEAELLRFVFRLDERYRTPIHLYYYEGYSIEEIAVLMGRKPATVGSWLARGRRLLKPMIGDENDER